MYYLRPVSEQLASARRVCMTPREGHEHRRRLRTRVVAALGRLGPTLLPGAVTFLVEPRRQCGPVSSHRRLVALA